VLLQSAASWCCYNQLACSHFLISFFLYLTIDSQEKRYYMLNDLWLFKGEFGYGLECLKEYPESRCLCILAIYRLTIHNSNIC
jgi:hypothetical protein